MQINRFQLPEDDNQRLNNLCGNLDEHLRLIEKRLGVEIANRGARFQISGEARECENAELILKALYKESGEKLLTPNDVHLTLAQYRDDQVENRAVGDRSIKTKNRVIRGRGHNQRLYLDNIATHDINFGLGPAGTGKTFLAVAMAVEALERGEVRRLILVRPAVEAGEKLGFLPGDLVDKIDPYLRPLYDALYEMLGFETVTKLIEQHTIEIAPLAFMRGRTLNDAFIILDEAQNTTIEQMKMFLTRIGFGSTAIITGDISQVDLPRNVRSGLRHAMDVLADVEGISMTQFNSSDVVRHPMVAKIINAYDRAEAEEEARRERKLAERRASIEQEMEAEE